MKIGDVGPLGAAIVAAIVPAGLLIALAAGLKFDMMMVLTIMVPGMSLAALMVSVSIGWIFILIGRLHRKPLWMGGIVFANLIAMLELLVLLILSSRAG
jgi:hypothetical protein